MYFKVLTFESAYALGFLAADDWISNNRVLGFALKRSDKASVEYISHIASSSELGDTYRSLTDYINNLD